MACGKPTMVAVLVVLASKFWKVLPKTGELETDFVTLAVFSCKHSTQIRTKEIFLKVKKKLPFAKGRRYVQLQLHKKRYHIQSPQKQ